MIFGELMKSEYVAAVFVNKNYSIKLQEVNLVNF